MMPPRKPAAFKLEEDKPESGVAMARPPRAISPDLVTPVETDVFEQEGVEHDVAVPPPPVTRRRSTIGSIFFAATGLLVSLAIGMWVDGLIRDMFSRSDWLGWFASAVAAVAAVAFVTILARELVGLARLNSVEKLRADGLAAITSKDNRRAKAFVADLTGFVSRRPETAAGRRAMNDLQGEIIDGPDLVRLAELELLAPLDARAQELILNAAKRVSVVTAVSPRALFDIAYVLFEAGRLIRRLAELYGGRPGTLGFVRLVKDVLAHLAVTGVVAAGDEFVHQVLGQGLAARLSAKLGEGVVNGMMTARIGVAAMETVRPMHFHAVKRPGMSDFLASLTRFAKDKGVADPARGKANPEQA